MNNITNHDNDGFTKVTYKRKRHNIKNMRGNGQTYELIQAVPSTTILYLSRLQKTVTTELINEYIQKKVSLQ